MFTEAASVSALPAISCAAEGSVEPEPHRPPGYRVATCLVGDAQRPAAERFVQDAFFRTHRARVRSFMPTLLTLTSPAGELCAVAGCRSAGEGRLFLEQYLDVPIEVAIARRTTTEVHRSSIVEVGNFACRSSRVASAFMAKLPRYLLGQGRTWVTFTATAAVRRILQHLDAHPLELATADGACVSGYADDWGQYYASDPRVMAGYLPLARHVSALWSGSHAD